MKRIWIVVALVVVGGVAIVYSKDNGISNNTTNEPSKTPTGFGSWKECKKDTVYVAATDGFVAAFTGGKKPGSEFEIYVGGSKDSLTVRTRAQRYDGTVCPVPKGNSWKVNSYKDGTVTVYWLPANR